MSCKKHSDFSFLAGALLGGIIGAGAALLLAPQSGEKTRKQLKGKADEVKLKAHLASKEAEDKFEEVKMSAEDKMREAKLSAEKAAREFRESLDVE